jgi:hypothetical protein
MESQLPQLAVELPRIRLAKQRPTLSEQINVERGLGELRATSVFSTQLTVTGSQTLV